MTEAAAGGSPSSFGLSHSSFFRHSTFGFRHSTCGFRHFLPGGTPAMSRIEHFAIFAADLEALRAFYEEALGLRVIVDNSRAPIRGYFLADDGGSVLEIIARPAGVPAADTRYVCHTAFLVDDYAAARAALQG